MEVSCDQAWLLMVLTTTRKRRQFIWLVEETGSANNSQLNYFHLVKLHGKMFPLSQPLTNIAFTLCARFNQSITGLSLHSLKCPNGECIDYHITRLLVGRKPQLLFHRGGSTCSQLQLG